MSTTDDSGYGIGARIASGAIPAPDLPWRPREPTRYAPGIGLIGCGGISEYHLRAYRQAGYRVVALCDRNPEKAAQRREEFFPKATLYTDYGALIADPAVEVTDVTTHPAERGPIIEAALLARKHVLSQKPFVTDLDTGQRLAELADRQAVKLAVNQNGRWAPHFSYLRQATRAGILGEIGSANFTVCWNHHWTVGTRFEEMKHLVLHDFAIHWFDMAAEVFRGRPARRVYAAAARSLSQLARPPFLAHVALEFDHGLATLSFNADCTYGPSDLTTVVGSKGTFTSAGPNLLEQTVTLHTAAGFSSPALEGNWFGAGFHGAMAELLCAIEEERAPEHSARNNLASLALAFAAVASAESGAATEPGKIRLLPEKRN